MPISHRIRSIGVDGGFLDGTVIRFNDHLNCLIGGRGTGKTTVIEFIRYALGFMPDARLEPKKARELDKLITANLGNGNTVTLEIETQSGLKYTVRRKGGEDTNVVKDEGGNIKQLDFRRSQVFDAEIYSQNDIENAASDPLDQLRIIDKFREEELGEIVKELSKLQRELDSNAAEIFSAKSRLASLQDDLSEIDGISEKLKALTVDAGEDPEEVSRHGAKIQAVEKEKKATGRLIRGLEESEHDLDSWLQSLERLTSTTFSRATLSGPNRGLLEELQRSINSVLPDIEAGVQTISESVSGLFQEADLAGRKIESKLLSLQEEYEELLARHQEVRGKVQERERLQKVYDDLAEKQRHYDELKAREAELVRDRHRMMEKLSELCDRRCAIRSEVAEFINRELGPMIRVRIIPMGNPAEYRSLLIEAMKRSQMQYTRIVERIVERIPPPELARLVQNGQVEELMEKLEIDRDRANKIIAQLQNTRELFNIESVELYDRPLIELKDGADYKAADNLSTGQKCTTILPILLLESVKPLIIDQPEDNLDNAFVYDTVVKSIQSSKQNRQLIFVTHNPNIPVLGDAENVVVLHSDGRQGQVLTSGDVDTVKTEIETILEGGKEAFEERRRRYGH